MGGTGSGVADPSGPRGKRREDRSPRSRTASSSGNSDNCGPGGHSAIADRQRSEKPPAPKGGAVELMCGSLKLPCESVESAGGGHPFDQPRVGDVGSLPFRDQHIVETDWHLGVACRRPKAAPDSISLHCISYSFPCHQPDADLVGFARAADNQKPAYLATPTGIENPAKIGPVLKRNGPDDGGPRQAASRLRPLALRALRIARPARSAIR